MTFRYSSKHCEHMELYALSRMPRPQSLNTPKPQHMVVAHVAWTSGCRSMATVSRGTAAGCCDPYAYEGKALTMSGSRPVAAGGAGVGTVLRRTLLNSSERLGLHTGMIYSHRYMPCSQGMGHDNPLLK